MTTEYLKKFKSLVAWLIPFLLAVFLLFGCGAPAKNQGITVPDETHTEAQVQAQAQTQAQTRTQTMEAAEAAAPSKSAAKELETSVEQTAFEEATSLAEQPSIEEQGSYTDRDSVALYLHTYGRLPDNYITKKQAEAAGWVSKEGNLWEVAPGKSIGGSRFGNYEKKLPDQEGRVWYECDINFDGSYRGAERIVYSDDGLIYYTGDHYQTFEQLY